MLGDLGGLIEIVFFISLSFIHPITQHSYTMNMIKKLFVGKTRDDELFMKPRTILKGDKL